jgi:hypothetical protein
VVRTKPKENGMIRNVAVILTTVLVFIPLSDTARAQDVSVESLPPSVIKTLPTCGDTKVPATTTQIKVTFSKEMIDGNWSFVQISGDSFPEIIGQPRYLGDKRTCILTVKLKPKKTYVLWLNSQKFRNFKDTSGNSAAPYLLVFQTK